MRKLLAVLFALAGFASQASAAEIKCPDHSYATCMNTYESRMAEDGSGLLYKYNCTCGDKYWVKQ